MFNLFMLPLSLIVVLACCILNIANILPGNLTEAPLTHIFTFVPVTWVTHTNFVISDTVNTAFRNQDYEVKRLHIGHLFKPKFGSKLQKGLKNTIFISKIRWLCHVSHGGMAVNCLILDLYFDLVIGKWLLLEIISS